MPRWIIYSLQYLTALFVCLSINHFVCRDYLVFLFFLSPLFVWIAFVHTIGIGHMSTLCRSAGNVSNESLPKSGYNRLIVSYTYVDT